MRNRTLCLQSTQFLNTVIFVSHLTDFMSTHIYIGHIFFPLCSLHLVFKAKAFYLVSWRYTICSYKHICDIKVLVSQHTKPTAYNFHRDDRKKNKIQRPLHIVSDFHGKLEVYTHTLVVRRYFMGGEVQRCERSCFSWLFCHRFRCEWACCCAFVCFASETLIWLCISSSSVLNVTWLLPNGKPN